ncbi:hypothetical protein LKO27_02700 [Tessaracoccus sp. OS52]|uniref:hypothetical protein n=1 Tax=Tessaracoccus sp. OS52 TaxID=2886691 RepID=UPI001D103050|nr:hypothetical protein [Tessaracoccus sp. OS52]MCC2592333.1 hypothetical protein [Tessaracoccus sp. OS52]
MITTFVTPVILSQAPRRLLTDPLRRLTVSRDGHRPPLPAGDTLAERITRSNESFVATFRQFSPQLVTDLLSHLGPQLDAHWAGQSLDGPADADVSWAGEGRSPRWIDLAREFTENWVHEQQIRETVSQGGSVEYADTVVDTFARALPHTLRGLDRPAGTRARLSVTGRAGGTWDCVRSDSGWGLVPVEGAPDAEVVMDQDTFWRLATRMISVGDARARSRSVGDAEISDAMTTLLAIVR